MSTSTDAILFWGHCWTDELNLLESDDDSACDEWPDKVAKKRGIVNPWDAFPNDEFAKLDWKERNAVSEKWSNANRVAIDAWNDATYKIDKEFDCDVGNHCSGNCSMPYVFVNGSETTAWRGYPKSIDPSKMTVPTDWQIKLKKFMAELGIVPPEGQKPGWFLVSYWGC